MPLARECWQNISLIVRRAELFQIFTLRKKKGECLEYGKSLINKTAKSKPNKFHQIENVGENVFSDIAYKREHKAFFRQ